MEKIVQYGKYYPFLDGFRALAVFWVLLHHLAYAFPIEPFWGGFYDLFKRISYLGFLGVDVFFVISGFLITGLLIDDLNNEIRLKRFYIRRFFKIVPHYLFIVLFGLMVSYLLNPNIHYNTSSIVSYFFFYQNYVYPIPILAHLWSISIEEHFYFLYPLLLFLISKLSKDVDSRRRLLFIAFVFLIILCNFIRFKVFAPVNSLNDPTVWQVTHVRFDALIFGCLLRLLEPRLNTLASHVKTFLSCTCFLLGAGLFIFFIFRFINIYWQYYALAYLASGALIISALLGYKPLKQITENEFLRWIGRNSYGIYLWHYVLKFPITGFIPVIGSNNAIMLYCFSSLCLGVATTITIERYFLNMRKKIAP